MSIKTVHNVKLGIFLLAGLLFLVLVLYMIGKNQHLFGKTYVLKARFENVNGLVPGNNVRVSGIQAGSVKRIEFIADTIIEITMLIDEEMKTIIRQNAIVSIGTDGLVGNKVVNITPARTAASFASEGDLLISRKGADTEAMLQTLSKTNNDAAEVAAALKVTIQRLNQSNGLWQLLNDQTIPMNLRSSAMHIQQATAKANETMTQLDQMVSALKEGKGTLGSLLTDSGFSEKADTAIQAIINVAGNASELIENLNTITDDIGRHVNSGNGLLQVLLSDTLMAARLQHSMDNIEKGTDGFNQNMEALKHNFLFRGYFRKQEKKQNNAK